MICPGWGIPEARTFSRILPLCTLQCRAARRTATEFAPLTLQPLACASEALARLDERLVHSPVGAGLIERLHFADACASLWLDGELVEMEDLVLHEAARDIRSPSHQLTIARDVLQTRRRIAA